MVLQVTGRSVPLGATVGDGGVNFSLFSRTATGVELLFFDREDDAKPARVITLDPVANRTYHYWQSLCRGCSPGRLYGYRVYGPSDPAGGLRFDPAKVLLDPYGRGVVVPEGLQPRGRQPAGRQRRDGDEERGGGSQRLRLGGRHAAAACPPSRTIIYEMHVRGFTRHPSSGVGREDARHLRRPDREDPVPAGARHHGGRAAAGLPVRRPGLPAGTGQLLGLPAGLVLRARTRRTARGRIRSARSTSSATWSRRCTGPASK